MGLVGTINAFALHFLPVYVLMAVADIKLGQHVLLLALAVAMQILQLFIVASYSLKSVPLSDVVGRAIAAACVPALFSFLLNDVRARKIVALNANTRRAELLATTMGIGALVVHHLGPFYYSIGTAGFDDGPLVSGVAFNTRLVTYLCTASALSNGSPLWLLLAVTVASGCAESLEVQGAAALLLLLLSVWFNRSPATRQN